MQIEESSKIGIPWISPKGYSMIVLLCIIKLGFC